MTNPDLSIHTNMVSMTQHAYDQLVSDIDISRKSCKLSGERGDKVENLLASANHRIKLLEDTLRATENELKLEKAKRAADELTEESQRLGEYK